MFKLSSFVIYNITLIWKVVDDEDQESNGEIKDHDEETHESEEDVYGVTTVVNLKKHQVRAKSMMCYWPYLTLFWLQLITLFCFLSLLSHRIMKLLGS